MVMFQHLDSAIIVLRIVYVHWLSWNGDTILSHTHIHTHTLSLSLLSRVGIGWFLVCLCIMLKWRDFHKAGLVPPFSQGPFDVIRTVFMPREGERELTLNEKMDLFFHDYSIGPLFVQENYLSVKPVAAR